MFRRLHLLLFSLSLFTLSYSQMKFGLKGGITQSSVREVLNLPDNEYSFKTGFQLGVFTEKHLAGNFIFRPSLQLTQKGYHSVVGNPGGPFYWERDLLTNYLELPLDLVYTFRLNDASNFFVGSGPVLSYGLNGRLKATLVTTDNNQQIQIKKSTDNKIFKNNLDQRFDFGWNANAGLQSCRMLFSLSYNPGITNVVKDDKQTLKNKSFAFSFGYLLH